MKILKTNNGFSLLEILIAIGLMGALSAWMMNIFTQQTKNEKTTATNMDIDGIGLEIRNILGDGSSCEKTLKGVSPNKAAAVMEIQKVLADGSVQKRFAASEKKVGNSGVKIVSYDTKTDETYFIPADTKIGETVLTINYDRGAMVQGAKLKAFKIPLNVSVDESGNIVNCHALASTTNLESICNALGRSVDTGKKKCSSPAIYKKGDTPVVFKQYARCTGGSGGGEKTLNSWTADGDGSVRLAWSGLATNIQVNWKVYKNSEILHNVTDGAGASAVLSSDIKSLDVSVKKGDVLKHTVSLSGGIDDDCITTGSFNVGLDLLNMM